MQRFRSLINKKSSIEPRNSLDTTSSMNTAETDTTCHTGGECSSVEFPDCPFLGNRTYSPCNELFKHNMGLTYLARRRDNNRKVVIKLVERGSNMTNHVAKELEFHRRCFGHPFITQLADLFLTPTHLAIVIEHIPDGDVLQLIHSSHTANEHDVTTTNNRNTDAHTTSSGNHACGLSEAEARWIFQQTLVAVLYLYSIGARNREIKLDNLLIKYEDDHHHHHHHHHQGGNTMPRAHSEQLYHSNGATSGTVLSSAALATTATTTTTPAAATAAAATSLKHDNAMLIAGTVLEQQHTEVLEMAWSTELQSYASTRTTIHMMDFSYSKSEQINSDPLSALGGLPYTAPEVLSYSIKEGYAADVWALGVVLFKMATGVFPFEREEDMQDARSTVHAVLGRIARVDYIIPGYLTPGLKDLLGRMLVKEPGKRIALEEIAIHPWVKENMPPDLMEVNRMVQERQGEGCPVSIEMMNELVNEAKMSLYPLSSENIEEMTDEILNEEEADELLDELAL